MGYNNFPTFDALEPLTTLPSLSCVYLEHNPIYEEFEYRKRLAALLPRLAQIDANPVSFRSPAK